MPTEKELQRAKSALKPVTSVNLGAIDTSGREFRRAFNTSKTGKVQFQSGHEFADMAASMRRGISEMKANLLENKGVDSSNPMYARTSMNEWARRTTNVLQGHKGADAFKNNNYVEQATRSIYDNWRAESNEFSPAQKRDKALNTLSSLIETSEVSAKTGVSVYDQSTKLSPQQTFQHHGKFLKSKKKTLPIDAVTNFAYRINPDVSRGKAASGKMSRLSLNMEMDDAPAMVKRMAQVVQNEPGLVRQSKIMGPENIGSRVDDAVVYLGQEPNVENAKRIDKALSKGMGQPTFSAAPPGMESLSPISSYAEYMPNTSSSHGSNRGQMVHEVVRQKLGGDATSTHKLMGASLEKAGYNPAQPSRIQTPMQNLLKNKLTQRRKNMGYED